MDGRHACEEQLTTVGTDYHGNSRRLFGVALNGETRSRQGPDPPTTTQLSSSYRR